MRGIGLSPPAAIRPIPNRKYFPMLMTKTTPWLYSPGLDHDQVREAVRALAPADLAAVVEAARTPFLGELVHTDQKGCSTGPRPVSKELATSGCVFAMRLYEGTGPRQHHWLTNLGWIVAQYVQPGGGDWTMPPQAVDLREALNGHHSFHTDQVLHFHMSQLGTLLCGTRRQLALLRPGGDVKSWLFTRVAQTVLCEHIHSGFWHRPLDEGSDEDIVTVTLRRAIEGAETAAAAQALAENARMPEAMEAYWAYQQEMRENPPL